MCSRGQQQQDCTMYIQFLSYLSCLRLSEDSFYYKKFSVIMVSFFAAAPRHVAVTNGSGRTGTTTELSCTFEGRPLPNIKWLAFGGDLTQVSVANFCFKRLSKELQSFLLYKMIVKSSLLAFWKKRAACYFPEGGFSKQDSSSTSLGSSLKLELERLLILEKQATQLQLLHTLFGLQKIMLLFNLDF